MKPHFTNAKKLKKLRTLLYDGLIIFLIFIFSYVIRILGEGNSLITELPHRISILVPFCIATHLLSFYIFGLYEQNQIINKKILTINLFLSISFSTGCITLISFLFQNDQIGRVLIASQFVLMIIIFPIWRFLTTTKLIPSGKHNVIVIGWNSLLDKISDNVLGQEEIYNIAGIVIPSSENIPPTPNNSAPLFHSLDEAIAQTEARTIVVTESPIYYNGFKSKLIDYKFKNFDIFSEFSFYIHVFGKVPVSELNISSLLNGHSKQFQPVLLSHIKRITDFVLSFFAILALSPVFLIIGLLIRLDSRGPVFFRQERLGIKEKPFILYKFRTMIENAEKDTGPCWATQNDCRFTKFGKSLRKSRIDELPQFINVLKGDMSLIGPRPIRKHFADIYSDKFPFYRLRFKVKPGITGWAQVNMDYVNTEQDQYEKLEYEVYYLLYHSIPLDLFIFIKTIQSFVKMRGG